MWGRVAIFVCGEEGSKVASMCGGEGMCVLVTSDHWSHPLVLPSCLIWMIASKK